MSPTRAPEAKTRKPLQRLTWSQGETVPPKHMNRCAMATRHSQMTTEKRRSSFLNTDSMHTRMKIAKKMARAVGTVIRNATWSSTSYEETKTCALQRDNSEAPWRQ